MQIEELSTPAVFVDLDIAIRNLDRMAALCREQGLGLRPHTKTHKNLEFAQLQLGRGALGLTVAKVGEAEVMAAAAPLQILVAHPILGAAQLERLARLTQQTEILIALDSEAAAEAISRAAARLDRTFGVLIEFDSGFHRCGVPAGLPCVGIGRTVERLPGLRLRGLMTYFGNIWGSEAERASLVSATAREVQRAVETFQAERLPLDIVSGGSTPAASFAHLIPGITEVRPGTYVFNDMNTVNQGACTLQDCAVRVLTTVVSNAIPGQAIIDAGSKTLSSDALGSGDKSGFGFVVGYPEVSLTRLNEEHGYLDVSRASPVRIGKKLSIVPNHVCSCINMHDEVFIVRGNEVIDSWKIQARGKVR